jgi:thiol-disulfide isomerase/thioredoxin
VIPRAYFSLLLIGSVWAGGLDYSLKDATGITHTEADLSRGKATVFIFVGTECPNSNGYAPVLARLYREYSARGVAFFNVYSDPAESASNVRKHQADFETPYAALLDPDQTLARETGARSTPEVVILGPKGQRLYRGRVDNRYVEPGKTRHQPTENNLDDALAAILSGKPVAHPVTRTIGCAIPGIE